MIRLLLVDDQQLICQGLKAMLSLELDLEVIGIAHNGQAALEQVEALKPDVVLMDLKMPVMDGREATRLICQSFPNTSVLVLTTFDDDGYIVDAMRSGAKGYLLKDMPSEELAQAIRLVQSGYTQLAPGLMDKLMTGFCAAPTTPAPTTQPSKHPALAQLTPREQEVLQLIGTGLTNRDIAQQLFISEGTVKTHVTHLLNRLNLRNRSQLAIYAHAATASSI
ncbi:MAG: response regulator transcription factor [Microcoleus sp. CSU_2_2]|nr:response regulator transcription factor [Microcoleus sp. SU_5_3]NJS10395.1 response regulator transcription factor [Microcoleus sp. CSU_2_2]